MTVSSLFSPVTSPALSMDVQVRGFALSLNTPQSKPQSLVPAWSLPLTVGLTGPSVMRIVQAVCLPSLVPSLFSRDRAVSGAGMGASYLHGWQHSPVLAQNELECHWRNSEISEV